LLEALLKQKVVPIFAPLTHAEGKLLNTNADTIASVLAVAMAKHFDVRLILCFEKAGVLRDVNDASSVIHQLPKSLYEQLLTSGSFHDGILPKLENAFAAIESGVKEVVIGEHTHLLTNTGEKTTGTLIMLS
jgi:acetylglutamate kinase